MMCSLFGGKRAGGRKLILVWLLAVIAVAARAAVITVDPATSLTNYWSGGEWNTDADFESWTTSGVSGAIVLDRTI